MLLQGSSFILSYALVYPGSNTYLIKILLLGRWSSIKCGHLFLTPDQFLVMPQRHEGRYCSLQANTGNSIHLENVFLTSFICRVISLVVGFTLQIRHSWFIPKSRATNLHVPQRTSFMETSTVPHFRAVGTSAIYPLMGRSQRCTIEAAFMRQISPPCTSRRPPRIIVTTSRSLQLANVLSAV